MTTTRERIHALIVDHLGCTHVKDDDVFAKDLACDSLDMLELGMAIEDEFHISVPDGDLDDLDTVGKAVAYVEGRVDR